MNTQTISIPVIDISVSDTDELGHLLYNRYKVVVKDSVTGKELELSTIEKVAENLKALRPFYLRVKGVKESYFLVADGFLAIHNQVQDSYCKDKYQKGEPVFGGTSYRLEIKSELFENGLPIECFRDIPATRYNRGFVGLTQK